MKWFRQCDMCRYAYGIHELDCPWATLLRGDAPLPPKPVGAFYANIDGRIELIRQLPGLDWGW